MNGSYGEAIVKVETICNFYEKLNRKKWRRGLIDEESDKNSRNSRIKSFLRHWSIG